MERDSPQELERDRLQQYFLKLVVNAKEEGFPEAQLVQDAENVWLDLRKRFGNQLPEPQAALALDGSLMFMWRRSGHYLELEVFPDGHKEAFYENEITGKPWEADIPPSASVTDHVLEKLSIFIVDKVNINTMFPDQEREFIYLRYVKGWTKAEIAEKMNIHYEIMDALFRKFEVRLPQLLEESLGRPKLLELLGLAESP